MYMSMAKVGVMSVGLPQYSAQASAMRGEPFSVILTRYYRDVTIASMQPQNQIQSDIRSLSASFISAS